MRHRMCVLLSLCVFAVTTAAQEAGRAEPLRLAIAGLVHGHVSGFLKAAQSRGDVTIVGIFDSDPALLRKYADRYTLTESLLFTDLGAMLDRAKPEAVASFTNTYEHHRHGDSRGRT
jgi:predicted dehydrogenase